MALFTGTTTNLTEEERNAILDAETVILFALAAAAIAIYLAKFYDAKGNRDRLLGKMEEFQDYLLAKKEDSLPILYQKAASLNALQALRPSGDACAAGNAVDTSAIIAEGAAFDNAHYSPVLPFGWKPVSGKMAGSMAAAQAAYITGILEKRRHEDWIAKEARIIASGQAGMKGVFSARSVASFYTQAMTIWDSLMLMAMGGLNSALFQAGNSIEHLSSRQSVNPANTDLVNTGMETGGGGNAMAMSGGGGD